jgi:hypothetical protein
MKRLNITFGTILLVLGCFALSPTAQAGKGGSGGGTQGGSIVGLWEVTYTSSAGNPLSPFQTYQQWHSDGLEIETPSFLNGVCMGTWKQMASNMVQLYHVGWTVGDPPGTLRFVLTETITVSTDGNSTDGTYDQTFYDANGSVVPQFTDMGTVHATRISVN